MIIAALTLTYTAFSASRSLPHLLDTSPKKRAARRGSRDEAEPLAAAAHGAGISSVAAYSASAPSAAAASPAPAATTGSGKDALAVVRTGTDPALDHTRDDDEEAGGSPGAYAAGGKKGGDEEDEEAAPPYSAVQSVVFLVILALAALYMAPVLTNWVTDPSDVAASRSSPATMWVNIATQWATLAVYSWTLIAPVLCPHRDFT